MDKCNIIYGFFVSMVIGWLVLWIFIDKIAWSYASKHHNIEKKKKHLLTNPLGMLERFLYTLSIISGLHEWIAVWLTIKTAVSWKRWSDEDTRITYNIFLIGNAISIIFGILGAWIAFGKYPFTK